MGFRVYWAGAAIAVMTFAWVGSASKAVSAANLPPTATVSTLLQHQTAIGQRVTASITGASPKLEAVVRRVLEGIHSSVLRRVRVGRQPPPDGNRPFPANALWLYIDAVEPNQQAGGIAGYWEASLLAGAVRAIAAARHLPPIYGVTIDTVLPNGQPTPHDGGYLLALDPPATAILDWTPASLTAAIEANAARAGLTLTSISIQQPLGLAVQIDVTIDDPSTAAVSQAEAALVGNSNQYEGVMFNVSDTSGTLVDSSAGATRAQTRTGWDNPNFPIDEDDLGPVTGSSSGGGSAISSSGATAGLGSASAQTP